MHLGALATAALVCAACSRRAPPPAQGDAAPQDAAEVPAVHAVARPKDAIAEFGVLTDRKADALTRIVAREARAALVDARFCGPPEACGAVRAFAADPDAVDVSIVRAEDWGLPPPGTLDTVAPGLSPGERASIFARPNVVVVHAAGRATPEHLVARAAFALTAAVAERTRGLVYDETLRRIESPAAFAARAITAPLADGAFRADRIVIQLYEQPDGTARLVSLGMRRFGAPDLEIRGASPSAARALGGVMNAVAARLASGTTEAPLVVSLDGKTATVDLIVPPREAGDPDNTVVRLTPDGGATPQGYEDLSRALVGATDVVVDGTIDADLAAATARAVASFPAALARWKRAPPPRPSLLVKLPFPLPGDAGVEWMWVDLDRVEGDTLHGRLANAPAYATHLKGGSAVTGRLKDLADWLMRGPDGGTEGGETIRVLESRN